MAQVPAAPQTEKLLATRGSFRWIQLFFGIICMVMIANLQYGWTLFVNPISDKFGWTRAAIQVAFSIFVLTETWLVPVEGYLVDRFGPRPVVLVGGLFCGIGWIMNSFADSLMLLYVAAAVSGVGAGAVYGTCVGNALKWFPDRRGLAAGLTAAGFGAGSALTVLPIQAIIKSMGYQTAFLYFGIGQGIVVMLVALAMVDPRRVVNPGIAKQAAKAPDPQVLQTKRDYQPIANCARAGVLGHVPDVRAGRGRRTDGGGAARADREGLQDRRNPGQHPRPHASRADVRADDRPCAEWPHATVLRLGVRSNRPRADDADRVHAAKASASCASTSSATSR